MFPEASPTSVDGDDRWRPAQGRGGRGGAVGFSSSATGRRLASGSLSKLVAAGLTVLVLGPTGVGAEQVDREDCEEAIAATADAYESRQTPDPETEQLARDCTTPVSDVTFREIESTGNMRLRGTSCKTIHAGYGYVNGFGQVIVAYQGHLRWCYNGNKVQGGEFWTSDYSCCFWFSEGVVHSVNRGCFGGCDHVYRERKASFIFNPPWPSITTRRQPWFQMNANKSGGSWTNSGG
jgi:hypothetical protein